MRRLQVWSGQEGYLLDPALVLTIVNGVRHVMGLETSQHVFDYT